MPGVSLANTVLGDNGEIVTLAPDRIITWDRNSGMPARDVPAALEFRSVVDFGRKLVYSPHESGMQVLRMETGEILATLTPVVGGSQKAMETIAQAGDQAPRVIRNLDQSANLESVLTPLQNTGWVVSTPDGHFDTNELDDIRGLQWVAEDEPLGPYRSKSSCANTSRPI